MLGALAACSQNVGTHFPFLLPALRARRRSHAKKHAVASSTGARGSPSGTAPSFFSPAAETTDQQRDHHHPPRERMQRDSTLTPPRFGVRTKVSLRADGFVPVLHLQGDVAIAVNALSGMQGVHARSPIPSSCTPLPRTHVFSAVCAARVSRGTRPPAIITVRFLVVGFVSL